MTAGFIEGQSDFSARNGFVVSDIDGVKKAIDWYAQRGYPQIKIYNSFRPEWVPEAVGLRPPPRPARQRARPGVHAR